MEEHQLHQLRTLGVAPTKKPIPPKPGGTIVLYPEKGYAKGKWPYEKFLEVYDRLRSQGVSVSLLEPFDTEAPHPGSFRFDDLSDVVSFLNRFDLFVSNDCGMAHLAASRGLSTITLFHEADHTIWHPLGNNRSLRCIPSPPAPEDLLEAIKTVSGPG